MTSSQKSVENLQTAVSMELAATHLLAAYAMAIFVVVHVYLATTGETVFC